jgi:drug/metabolite transporter (DMT)-like permease
VTGALAGPTLGIVAALVCALTWTVLSLVARHLSTHFSPFSLNVIRSGVGAVLLLPLALLSGQLAGVTGVSAVAWAFLMASVLIGMGIGDTAFFESTKTLGLARAMTISTAYPLIASVLALVFFGERITLAVGLGSLVTLAGLVLIVSEGGIGGTVTGAGRERGLVLAIIAACAWAVGAVLMKPPLREIDPLTIQAARMPLVTLALWALPWSRGTVRGLWAHRQVVGRPVLLLGALTALSAVSYLVGLKHAGVTLGTVLASTSPLFALPIGFLAFGERVTWRATAGALLSIAGIAVLSV